MAATSPSPAGPRQPYFLSRHRGGGDSPGYLNHGFRSPGPLDQRRSPERPGGTFPQSLDVIRVLKRPE